MTALVTALQEERERERSAFIYYEGMERRHFFKTKEPMHQLEGRDQIRLGGPR